jgi:hypothetical protein
MPFPSPECMRGCPTLKNIFAELKGAQVKVSKRLNIE